MSKFNDKTYSCYRRRGHLITKLKSLGYLVDMGGSTYINTGEHDSDAMTAYNQKFHRFCTLLSDFRECLTADNL
jgi:hypothetical protein